MKKSNLEEFFNVFFSNEIILILLVVLIIILIILIVYLVKLEKKDNKKLLKQNIELNNISKNNKETVIEEEVTNNDPLGLFNNIMPTNDEENAIISTDELIKASKDLSDTLQMDTTEIIDMYEAEQEKKAIISYEELLKNAASLNIKYEEPKEKEIDTPVVKKIEVSNSDSYVKANVESTNKIMNYVEEEEFLKVLKKFRLDLET